MTAPSESTSTSTTQLEPLPSQQELETNFTSQQLRQMLQERQNQQQIWEAEVAGAMATLQTQKNVGMNQALVDPEGFPRDDIDVWAVRQARNTISTRQNDLKKIGDELKMLLEATFAAMSKESSQTLTNDGAEPTESIEERNMKRFEQRRREREAAMKEQKNHDNNDNNDGSTTIKQISQKEKQQQKLNELWEEAGVVPVASVHDVAPHSPAFLAGLIDGDLIIAVGEDKGHSDDHLKPEDSVQPMLNLGDFAAVIKKSEGKSLRIVVQRKNENKKGEILDVHDLVLVPKQWSGNGILGCGLDPVQ